MLIDKRVLYLLITNIYIGQEIKKVPETPEGSEKNLCSHIVVFSPDRRLTACDADD
ncbi:MAG: hypothetical protein WDZ36_05865 [Balneolaceae bacterium]